MTFKSPWSLLAGSTHRRPAASSQPGPDGLLRVNRAPSRSERVDQRLKRRRLVTAARVIEEETVERSAPVLEHPHEAPTRDVLRRVLFQLEGQSHAVQRGPQRELDVIDDEGSRHGDGDRPAALLELPSIDGAVGAHAISDAAVGRQVARRLRLRVRTEVRWGGDDGGALLTRDLHGHHVALEELAEVDAGVEPAGDQVAAAVVLGGDVE